MQRVFTQPGSKADIAEHGGMSALPPKADIGTQPRNVRFVLKADISQFYWITPSARSVIPRDAPVMTATA